MRTPNFTTNSSSLSSSSKLRLSFLSALMFFLGMGGVWGQYSSGTFTKISSFPELTDGYYVVAYGTTFAMNNTNAGSYFENTSITPTSGTTITDPSASIVWKIETSGSYRTIFNEASGKYVSYSGSSNNAFATSAISNNEKWTFAFTSSLFTITNVAVTNRLLKYNATSPRFACYISGQANITLYKISSPVIYGAATATAFTTTYGNPSTAQTFSISGSNLTAGITATAPTGFEVSNDGTTYGETATFTQSSGSASGTLRIRLKANAGVSGTFNSKNIVLSSTGATSVNVATSASGNAVSAKGLTITGLAAANKNWDETTTVSVTGTPEYTGLVNSESFSVTGIVSWAFPNSNVGNNITLTRTGSYDTPSSNYTVTQPTLAANITAIVPSAPTITSITPGNAQLSVAFTAPTSNGGASITNYAYSIDNGVNFTVCSPLQTTSPILISGLTNGVTYDIQIRAVNSAGSGAASTTTQATPAAPSSPTITANIATLTAFTTTYGTASAAQSISVSGAALTADLLASAPTGFELATSQAGTYGTTATFTQTGGSVSGTVWVRFAATAAVVGSYDSQTIQLTSTNATTVNVATAVSGNLVSAKGLTITSLSAANKNWDGTSTASVTGTPTYTGLVNGESFLVTGTVTWAFPNSNVGNNITLTRTGSYDAPSVNYTVTQPILTASINAVVCTEPIITAITNGDAQLSVAFTAPSSSGGVTITNYEYSTDGGVNWSTPSPAVTSSPILISGLTNGTTYNIQLRGINSAGFGAASTTVQGTPAASQTTDYFRSKTSGNWNASSTWESSTDNINWIAATLSPTTSANTITILNTHNVTVSASVSIDQLVVNQGGLVTVNANQTLTIVDGSGDDITINGTLRNAGTITTTGNLVITSTGTYEHNHTTTTGVIPTATWSSGSTCSIIGYTSGGSSGFTPGGINQAFHNFTWNCPNQTARSILAINTNTTFSVSGTFNLVSTNTQHVALASNSSAFNSSIANFNISGGTLFFIYGVSNDGTYRGTITSSGNYTQSGGTVYLANGSTAGRIVTTQFNLTGSNSSFTQSGGTFYMTNVPPATTAPLNVAITLSGLNASLNIQNNANFYFSGGTTSTGSLPVISLTGSASSLSQTGGQIDFNPNNSTGSGKMNLSGSFNRSGTSIMTCTSLNAQNGLINFNGTNQTLNDLAISGNLSFVDFTISSGSTVTLQNDFLLTTLTTADPSTLTINAGGTLNCGSYIVSNNSTGNAGVFVNNGTLGIGSANGISSGTSLSGNIQVTSSRTYASSANYVYYGSSTNMITGNGLPSSLSGSLTIDNVSGVSLSSNLSLSNSLVLTSGTLDIGANTLTINGSISGSGQIDASSGTIAFGNASNLSLPTSLFTGSIANLSKTAGAGTLTLNDALTTVGNLTTTASTGAVILAASKQLTVSGTLTNNGTLTLQNGATFKQGSNVAGGGTYNIQQNLDNCSNNGTSLTGRYWYLGSPVTSLRENSFGNAGGLNKVWSFTNGAYTAIQNGQTLTPTTGYVHRRGTNASPLTFSGQNLYATDVTLSLSNNAGTYGGWHLIANPYTAYLDWQQVYNASYALSTAISPSYYIRSFNTSGNDVNALITYNSSTGLESNTSSYSLGSTGSTTAQQIAPMQAFWVKINSTTPLSSTAGQLRLERAFTSHQTGNVGLKNSTVFPTLARVNLVDGARFDQMLVFMNQDMSNAVDQYDSEKMFVSGAPQIYTMAAGKKLVMNGLKNNKKKISVPLYLELPESKVYNLQLAEYILEDGLILLEDKQEGIIQDFTIHDVYPFYANSGVLSNRFVLHFFMPDATITAQGPSNTWVENESSYTEGGNILISSDPKGKIAITLELPEDQKVESSIQVSDANGRIVYNAILEGLNTEFQLHVPSGVYYLTVQSGNLIENKKVFIQE